jgi:hypothetical protein
MISGTVIQVIFVLGLIGIVIGAIVAIANDDALLGILLLVFGALYWRVVCEFIIVVFRMNASLNAIRANTAGLAPALPSLEPGTMPAPQQAVSEDGAEELTTEPAALPPEGWYDDSERPGHKRWWDGTAWGTRDDEASSE